MTRPSTAARDIGRLARGGMLSMAGFLVSAFLQFAMVVIVTRGLPTGKAGAFLEAVALFMIVSIWGELGADDALVRMVARLRALGRAVDIPRTVVAAVIPVGLVGVVTAAATFGLAHPIAHRFFSPDHRRDAVTYVRLLSLLVPVASVTTVALAATRGFATMRPYVAVQNFGIPVVRLAGVGLAVLAGGSPTGISAGWGVPLVLGCAMTLALLTRLCRAAYRHTEGVGRPMGVIAGEVWRFAAPRGLAGGFSVTMTYLDVLLVGALASTREAAIYAAVSRLAIVGTYAIGAVRLAVAPQFSELLATEELSRLETLYRVSTWWMMVLSWPVYILFVIFAPVVMALFGHSYTAGSTALLILAVAGLFNLGTGNVTLLLLMAGNSVLNMVNTGIALALNVALNLILIPRYGMEGAAFAWAVSIVTNNLAALLEVRWLLRLRPFGPGYWRVVAANILAFGALGEAIRFVAGATSVAFAVAVVSGTALYAVVIWREREVLALSLLPGTLGRKFGRHPA